MKEDQKNNHDIQQRLEEYHLEVFSKFISLPGEQLPRQKNQRPDFIFHNGDQLIGIELTGMKNNKTNNETKLKGTHRQIINRAQHTCSKQGIPPLCVEVLFNDCYYNYSNKGRAAVETLVETISSNLNKIEAVTDGSSIELKPKGPFTGIISILAAPGKAWGKQWLSEHRWNLVEIGWVNRVGFESELQSVIDRKNNLIGNYLQKCNECWLLIVADRSKADQKYEFTEAMRYHCFKSRFHGTFFLEVAKSYCIELTTEN